MGRKLLVNRIVRVASYQVKEHRIEPYLGLDKFHLVVRMLVREASYQVHRIVACLGLDKYHLVVRMLIREAYYFDTQAIQSLDHKVEAYCNHDVLLLLFVLHKHHDET